MLNSLKKVTVLSIAFLFCAENSMAGIYQGATDEQSYQQLIKQLNDKYQQLIDKIQQAKSLGLTTDYAQVSQVTIALFKDTFVPWDKANIEQVSQMYEAKYFSRYDPSGAQALPFDELADCIEVADAALLQLQRQIDGQIILQPTPDFSKGKLQLRDDYYYLNGQPIISSKFFWQPKNSALMQAFGTGGEAYYSVQDLASETQIKPYRHKNLINSLQQEKALSRQPVQFFLGHIVPSNFWLRNQYPVAFEKGQRLFTDYDIDNPYVKNWLDTLFQQQLKLGVEAVSDTEKIHMMANEPTFSIREGGVNASQGLSEYTLDKYQHWLEAKYQSIEQLNNTYKANFTSFAELQSQFTPPLALRYQGSAVWYDWNRFNMDRVNDWFSYLHQAIKTVDPTGKTHIKIMGERAIHNDYHDEGIDFEFIAKLVDFPGSDNQLSPLAAQWDVRKQNAWQTRYSLEWRSQAIMLDFIKSLAPNKLFYDSEWHGLSGARWRDFHMSPEYVRSALWLAVTDGLGALTTWVWNRKVDGAIDPRADFIGTSVTQPIQLDAYGRTIKEINAHAKQITSLVAKQRYLVIYYSQDSAIQDSHYSQNMADVYESLKLLNIPVGFTTPSELENLDSNKQILIVPNTKFISDPDLTALKNFSQQGGKIIAVNQQTNFNFNELGQLRTSAFPFSPYAEIDQTDVLSMADKFALKLDAILPKFPVSIKATTEQNVNAYGIIAHQATFETTSTEDSRQIVSLVNTSQQTLTVTLTGVNGEISDVTNVITSEKLSGHFSMKPMDVYLLSVDAKSSVDSESNQQNNSNNQNEIAPVTSSKTASGGSVYWFLLVMVSWVLLQRMTLKIG